VPRPETLEAYRWPPSTAAIAAARGLAPDLVIRFDGNVPAAPLAVIRPAAIAHALADVNEYDRGRYETLRRAIAAHHGVGLEHVALGAGSDEFIVLLARLFASGGTVATVPERSYSMYRFAAAMAGATVINEPDLADIVFVCRPNNPTGELPPVPKVRGQLVIDEAYAQYAGVDETSRWHEGAIILRTFSKAYGLAGARVGYAIADPLTIELITSRQAPLSVSSLSAALALVALDTPLDLRAQLRERERLGHELGALGLAPTTSHANFLFVPMASPEAFAASLLPFGIVVRAFGEGVRISVRDELDDDLLLDAVRSLRSSDSPCESSLLRHRRTTAETRLLVRMRLSGEGRVLVDTGQGFYDHMLEQLAFHAGMDLRVDGIGDHEVGEHHTVEDTMCAVGEALDRSLGDRRGFARFGEARVPMDEALAHAVVDLSGRAGATIDLSVDPGMATHALESLARAARLTLHVTASGRNDHHVAEASFKAVGRALSQALVHDGSLVRSTKGSL
jgi:histidinol-phosphate/aromatic aminotransferase/cobyric acid decarboxylase-like protein/imidazoleglycerol phosphate dehydratase HisB